ncbi:MAG: zinc metallopeptidase, partial [Clostridia bacterium]|nr:zinc metallopeptidase [Clostridia bacterium]
AQMRVSSTYKQYATVPCSGGLTGAAVARKILDCNGLSHIRVERIRGELTDHFDPKAGVIRLSEAVYDMATVSSVGIAAHEAGHALQYAQNYGPIRLRAAIVPMTRYSSWLAIPLFMLGLWVASDSLMLFGVLLYAVIAFFQLVTLPVEFNASNRALRTLGEFRILSDQEMGGAKKVLGAAAMTYVAALLTSVLTLLRLLLLANNRRR